MDEAGLAASVAQKLGSTRKAIGAMFELDRRVSG
jgi:hypothetical protein